jgi:hypothetical protein
METDIHIRLINSVVQVEKLSVLSSDNPKIQATKTALTAKNALFEKT